MEYPLCDQTVTIYRKQGETTLRQVVQGCYLEHSRESIPGENRQKREFLLVMPGNIQRVFPGDRVLPGVGPEEVDWDSFLPIFVEDLLVVSKTKRFYFAGKLSHVEAM